MAGEVGGSKSKLKNFDYELYESRGTGFNSRGSYPGKKVGESSSTQERKGNRCGIYFIGARENGR